MDKFMFRGFNQKFRHAVNSEYDLFGKNFQNIFTKAVDNLAEWMAKELFCEGYKFSKSELLSQDNEWGSPMGICAFVTGEKYDDVRGALLRVIEKSNELKEENDRLKFKIRTLEIDYSNLEFERIKCMDPAMGIDLYDKLPYHSLEMEQWKIQNTKEEE